MPMSLLEIDWRNSLGQGTLCLIPPRNPYKIREADPGCDDISMG